ncbi:MAG: zinc-dependent alcohol dehydrogenase [Hyphomicrobiaceae bacterium]
MRALVLEGERRLSLRDVDTPAAGSGHVLIDVEVASIGGSEYLGYNNPGIRTLPNIMGHGFAGRVDGRRVAVNPVRGCGNCGLCRAGYRQLCDSWTLIGVQSDGGFAEFASVPQDAVVELPNTLNWKQAAFVEPFANSVNAWELSNASERGSVAVIGAGSLGLGVVACAVAAGCEHIAVSDLSETRLAAAAHLGAGKIDAEKFYDVVFDTVGSEESRSAAFALTRKLGTVVLLGFASSILEINAGELIRGQKRVVGAFAYSPKQFNEAIKLAECTQSDWVKNIPFQDVEPLLNCYLDGDFSVVKAALRPGL